DAEGWLSQNGARPFFLFLHLYDLHTPYVLPQRVAARYGKPAYNSELRYVDDVLGEFTDFLKDRGLFDKSLIVFTSDHGESLSEHGESTHGYFIYQSTLRVPLVFHWPRTAAVKPARVSEPVSLLDVAPTLLELLRIPSPPQFQGRGLLSLASGKATAAQEEIYSESLYPHRHFGASALRAIRRGSLKYIQAPRPELYDLSRDPGESHNLYAESRPLAAALHERLTALLSRYAMTSKQPRTGPPPEVVERLNSLGYAAVSSSSASPPDSGPDPKDRLQAYEDYGRGLALSSAGKLTEANALLEGLLARTPDLVDVRLSLGLGQQKLGLQEDAARTFQQVLKSDPANALAHFDLGASELALHRLDGAMREFDLALAIEPYYTRAEDLLARALLDQRKFDTARAHFEHVLTVDPADYAAHYNLGVLDAMQQRWADAERHLTAALEADPASAEAHNTLGSVYLQRRDLDRAAAQFAGAIELQPKSAASHYNLGLVLLAKGDRASAAREFQRALSADPQFRSAREALDRLESGPK
ncbi:MAG TPA: tetratricopeptide repeat protein, partial [Terriglobia bacterium]|nr:tetratricopeptide repeat protein [Terriglobia bacterium]